MVRRGAGEQVWRLPAWLSAGWWRAEAPEGREGEDAAPHEGAEAGSGAGSLASSAPEPASEHNNSQFVVYGPLQSLDSI